MMKLENNLKFLFVKVAYHLYMSPFYSVLAFICSDLVQWLILKSENPTGQTHLVYIVIVTVIDV